MAKTLEIVKRDFPEEEWDKCMQQIELTLSAIAQLSLEEMGELNRSFMQFELGGGDDVYFLHFSAENHLETIRSLKERNKELEALVSANKEQLALNG